MVKGFLNIPWIAWSALAFIVAIIYSFIWPNDRIRNLTGFRFLVLRWAHALTWFLLAVNFLLRGIDASFNGAADIIALGGGLAYISFLLITIVVK
jgi:hypothetical protein